jgi:hypothetical protein
MIWRPGCILALVVASIGPARAAAAQAADCTYDRCALRLQVSAFSEQIVQGAAAVPVGRLGLFASRIGPLAEAGDSTRTHYDAYRTRYNRGGALALVGVIATVASLLVLASTEDYALEGPQGAFLGLLGVGAGFSIAGGISIRSGRDHLHQAMWLYNRSLKAAP